VAWVLKETGSQELALAAGALVTGVAQYLGKLLRNYAAEKGGTIHLSP
jgi:hypothetical protein